MILIIFFAVFEREREEAAEEIGGAAEEGGAGGEGGAEGDPEGQGRGSARRLHRHCQVRGRPKKHPTLSYTMKPVLSDMNWEGKCVSE